MQNGLPYPFQFVRKSAEELRRVLAEIKKSWPTKKLFLAISGKGHHVFGTDPTLSVKRMYEIIDLSNRDSEICIALDQTVGTILIAQEELQKFQSSKKITWKDYKLKEIARDIHVLFKHIVKPVLTSFPIYQSIPLRRLVNVGLKKPVEHDSIKEMQLHDLYDGYAGIVPFIDRYREVKEFLESKKSQGSHVDRNGLKLILKMRYIMCELMVLLPNLKTLCRNICTRVDMLDIPDSDQVVQLCNGAAFSFVSGTEDHCMVCEVRRDKQEYFFIVHNRGYGSDNVDFHGDVIFEESEEEFKKSSVWVQIKKEHLSYPFFEELLFLKGEDNIQAVYTCLTKYLLCTSVAGIYGTIIIEPKEQEFLHLYKSVIKESNELELCDMWNEKLYIDINANPQQAWPIKTTPSVLQLKSKVKTLRKHKLYRKPQYHGTCPESNGVLVEKLLCDSLTRKQLKWFSLERSFKKAKKIQFDDEESQKNVLALTLHRLERLKKKIEGMKQAKINL